MLRLGTVHGGVLALAAALLLPAAASAAALK